VLVLNITERIYTMSITKEIESDVESEIADQEDERPTGDEYDEVNEERVEDLLTEALVAFAEDNDDPCPDIQTFEEAGVLTMDRGLILRFGRGEFQVSIVRSR
jgi:hypothetical protein